MATEKVKLILEAQDRMSKQIDKANKKLSMTSKIAASAKTALIGVFGLVRL